MLRFFHAQWDSVPIVVIDTETTGLLVGKDKAVSVALVRFENGKPVGSFASFVNPGFPIPAEATAIHKITDAAVQCAPTVEELFADPRVTALLEGAQPAAYNGPFDKHFVPPFGEDWTWPWLDALSLVRKVDRYAKGAGRHKLAPTCERHGIALDNAHDAESDARAAGELLLKLGKQEFPQKYALGQALGWQRRSEAEEWFRFNEWLSKQPPREAVSA